MSLSIHHLLSPPSPCMSASPSPQPESAHLGASSPLANNSATALATPSASLSAMTPLTLSASVAMEQSALQTPPLRCSPTCLSHNVSSGAGKSNGDALPPIAAMLGSWARTSSSSSSSSSSNSCCAVSTNTTAVNNTHGHGHGINAHAPLIARRASDTSAIKAMRAAAAAAATPATAPQPPLLRQRTISSSSSSASSLTLQLSSSTLSAPTPVMAKLPSQELVLPILQSIPKHAMTLYFDFNLMLLTAKPASVDFVAHSFLLSDIVHTKDHTKLPQLLQLAKSNLNAIQTCEAAIREQRRHSGQRDVPHTRPTRPRAISSPTALRGSNATTVAAGHHHHHRSSHAVSRDPYPVKHMLPTASTFAHLKTSTSNATLDAPLGGTDVYQLPNGLRFFTGIATHAKHRQAAADSDEPGTEDGWRRFHVWVYLARKPNYCAVPSSPVTPSSASCCSISSSSSSSSGSSDAHPAFGSKGEYLVMKLVMLP